MTQTSESTQVPQALARAGSLMSVETEADAERRVRLRRMQAVALGLLVFAAVVYVVTLDQDGFLGFVNAGAEASMVGAIADWFAVTALFRHPLGLPIPHTALVPRKKDEFGKSLEEFFAENFLQEEVIRERLAAADIARRAGVWLSEPANARRVVAEGATVVAIGLRKLRDEDVAVARRGGADPAVHGRADLAGRGRPAPGDRRRQRPPRPRRPRARGGPPLAGAQPGDLRRGRR